MKISLRQEQTTDHPAVEKLVQEAFKDEIYSDHSEHFLVRRLRDSDAFIPELSIVAEFDGKFVGHILLTEIKIENEKDTFPSLSLAPVSVKPEYQKQGIGGRLIRKAHQVAKNLGYRSIVVLGHENYYPKFGYKPAENYDIQLPFEAPPENCLVIELVKNGLRGVSGKAIYPKAFYE